MFLCVLGLLAVALIINTCLIWFVGHNQGFEPITSPTDTDDSDSLENVISVTTTTTTIPTSTFTIEIKFFFSNIFLIFSDSCTRKLVYQLQAYATGFGPKTLISNDFNHDTWVDLAVTNSLDDTISILLGNANLTFQNVNIYPLKHNGNPWGITSTDFNNDGLVDLGERNTMTSASLKSFLFSSCHFIWNKRDCSNFWHQR